MCTERVKLPAVPEAGIARQRRSGGRAKSIKRINVPELAFKMKKIKSAIDIIRLPKQEREAILRTAAKKAEREYLDNTSLTSFDAFSEADLYDETSRGNPGDERTYG